MTTLHNNRHVINSTLAVVRTSNGRIVVSRVDEIHEHRTLELACEKLAISLQDVHQVVVFLPIGGRSRVDLASALVVQSLGEPVGPHRPEDSLPDVKLIARSRVSSEHEFSPVHFSHGCCGLSIPER